jgi:hypothetical protein
MDAVLSFSFLLGFWIQWLGGTYTRARGSCVGGKRGGRDSRDGNLLLVGGGNTIFCSTLYLS